MSLRKLLPLAICLAPALAQAYDFVPLDRPGVLEAIEAADPDRHRRLLGILAAAQEMPCDPQGLARAEVSYDARAARCSLPLLTSYPAKRWLTFTLDEVRYAAMVTMNADARLMKVPTAR